MINKFREYHQYSNLEIKNLWANSLFVFDTNTLLNMYRYSRKTVDAYFRVLDDLKKKKRLWIPYQVGFEFYENRIKVISEYQESYDEILKIIDKAECDIVSKYKNHPFLNLPDIKEKMDDGLKNVKAEIEAAKEQHPNWIDKDDVLDKINEIFENSVGENYSTKKIAEIEKEGQERYSKKIPPGFKDKEKNINKYGDLILWFQIIDKANEIKKPIILISGDVKEDWWLENRGKKIMPLPQLKKEMYEKADVDFHLYTADKFLEYYINDQNKKKGIDFDMISEVRKIREIEEEKKRQEELFLYKNKKRIELVKNNEIIQIIVGILEIMQDVLSFIGKEEFYIQGGIQLQSIYHHISHTLDKIQHSSEGKIYIKQILDDTEEFIFSLRNYTESINPSSKTYKQMMLCVKRLHYFVDRLHRVCIY